MIELARTVEPPIGRLPTHDLKQLFLEANQTVRQEFTSAKECLASELSGLDYLYEELIKLLEKLAAKAVNRGCRQRRRTTMHADLGGPLDSILTVC